MDGIRNEHIRRTAQVGRFADKTRELRLRQFGHGRRRDGGYIRENDAEDEKLPGKRKRGRSKGGLWTW